MNQVFQVQQNLQDTIYQQWKMSKKEVVEHFIEILTNMKTQCDKILEVLLAANGDWVNARKFVHEMWLSQCSARITELRHKGYKIETSPFRDCYRFVSYRLLTEPKQEVLAP